jgi:uncharacterized glyoxalase superfamily protein PhnB
MSESTPKVYPALRYEDAPAMIDWLCKAFGFKKRVAYPGPDGSIAHAELSYGADIIMLGSTKPDGYGESPKQSGRVTGTIYIATTDIDAHCERAKAAGAEVFRGPEDTDYGSREYSCRDPERHIWTFGTYRPVPEA